MNNCSIVEGLLKGDTSKGEVQICAGKFEMECGCTDSDGSK
jgi:hypothetical protein